MKFPFLILHVFPAKLLSNFYLSLLIAFLNKSDELIKRLEVNNSLKVARLMFADARMSTYGTSKFEQPFRGKCLPTRMDELIDPIRCRGLNPHLSRAVRTYNLRIKTQHDDT
jgi:UDP-glucose 6-dehydrogenase